MQRYRQLRHQSLTEKLTTVIDQNSPILRETEILSLIGSANSVSIVDIVIVELSRGNQFYR